MRAVEKYLSKFPESLIHSRPSSNLGIVVTIPAFNEAETIKSIDSLLACDLPQSDVEILVNVNFSELASEGEKEFNKMSFHLLKHYAEKKSTDKIKIHVLYFPNQKKKVAGVGWARKQIMDEAFRRFMSIDNNNGIITGFDADATCQSNYLTELENFFACKPQANACSIYFEHDIEGTKYSEGIYNAIILYELHLRYFINAQKLIGVNFAYQTVGSSFAVKATAYARVNGMSPKKAGEDFYFLHKTMALDGFYTLNTTCIYPSSRISNRVGFGTGPSVGEISKTGKKKTYAYRSFLEIKKIYDALPQIYKQNLSVEKWSLDPVLLEYLQKQNTNQVVQNLIQNNKSYTSFKLAFMQWLGGFQILKILNILRETEYFKDIDIIQAVNQLNIVKQQTDAKKILAELRQFDRNNV